MFCYWYLQDFNKTLNKWQQEFQAPVRQGRCDFSAEQYCAQTNLCICETSSCPNCLGNLTVHSLKSSVKGEELLGILEMSGQGGQDLMQYDNVDDTPMAGMDTQFS